MTLHFIKSSDKKKIVQELDDQYGLKELNYLLIQAGRERIRAFSGSLSKEEIIELGQIANIETIGMYMINNRDDDFRISFDALSLVRDHITKNKLIITKEQLAHWIRGYDLTIPHIPRGIVVLVCEDQLVGIGKSNTEKIFNYVPKERKVKTTLPSSSVN